MGRAARSWIGRAGWSPLAALALLSCSSSKTLFPDGSADDAGVNSALGAAPVSLTDASASSASGVVVALDYTVHPASGGPAVSWGCASSNGASPAVGTFQVDVTSFQEGLPYGQGKTSDSVHGTMHAVCPQKLGSGGDGGDSGGSVTLDGPF